MTVDAGYTFAFQPIVDWTTGQVVAQEALIRGPQGEGAAAVLSRYTPAGFLRLDGEARVRAIELAARLDARATVSLNFSPAALGAFPDSIQRTLDACERVGIDPSQLILEMTENAVIANPDEFASHINPYRARGVRLAIDDFGAGYAGLNLLADFQPDIVKIDLGLVRDIDRDGPRQAIARGIIQVCRELGVEVIAEGVETAAELEWFCRRGVRLFQGYFIGRPSFELFSQPARCNELVVRVG